MTDNKNFNQRFDQLEKRLDELMVSNSLFTMQNPSSRSDEIDLRKLFTTLWLGKWWIIGVTFLFGVAGVMYALSLPNMYEARALLVKAQDSSSRAGGLSSRYAGLAAMAGVDVFAENGARVEQAMELMTSWPFLESFIDKYGLKPKIVAATHWDIERDDLIYDSSLYDSLEGKWLEDETGESLEPSSWEAFQKIKKMLNVTYDSSTDLIGVSVEYYSPKVAEEWLSLLIREVNGYYQQTDMLEAQKSIEFLELKIAGTSVSNMQAVFYNMIEVQTKTLMLAEVSDEYLLKTVVPPKAPERKSSPRRLVICIVFAFLGGLVGLLICLIDKLVIKK